MSTSPPPTSTPFHAWYHDHGVVKVSVQEAPISCHLSVTLHKVEQLLSTFLLQIIHVTH